MANQAHSSPQLRTRKPPPPQQQQQQQPSSQTQSSNSSSMQHGGATTQSTIRRERERESSPSPSLRDQHQQHQQAQVQQQQQQAAQAQAQRQRYVRTQSMPIVATQTHAEDFDFEFDLRDDPGPPSSSSGAQQQGQQQAPSASQASPYTQQRPVPISRASQPAFIQGRPAGVGVGVGVVSAAEKWQMTDDLQADIDRADLLQQQQLAQAAQRQQQSHSPVGVGVGVGIGGVAGITIPPNPAPGTAGVAYAGGAASAGAAFVSSGHGKSLSGSSAVGVGDVMEGSSPGGAASASGASLARRRTVAAEQSVHRASPLSYALRKGANTSPGYPPGVAGGSSMPSPRSMKNRTPDRSLPVQEEPDEHDQQQHQQQHQQARVAMGTGSGRVTPASVGSDHSNAKDMDHDGEGTLVDLGDDDDDEDSGERAGASSGKAGGASSGAGTQESTEGEGSHTPRSPTNPLYPQSHGAHAHAQLHHQRSIHEVLLPDRQQHVNGNKRTQAPPPINGAYGSASTSNQANRNSGFNPQEFHQTLKKLQSHPISQSSSPYPTYPPYAPTTTHPPSIPPPPFSPFSRAEFSRNESRGSYPTWMFDFYHNYPGPEEVANGDGYYEYDEAAAAASAYMQQFIPGSGSGGAGTGISAVSGSSGNSGHVYPYAHLQGHAHMRPDAPIPPTPHSQTSAPTPFRRQQQQHHHPQRRDSADSRGERGRSGSRVRAQEEENGGGGVANEDAEGVEDEDQNDGGGGRGREVVDDSGANREDDQQPEGANRNGGGVVHPNISQERFVPPFSPAPPSGTPYPYPYPFSHVRRVGGYVYPRASHPSQVPPPPPSVPIHPGQIASAIPRVPSSMYEYNSNGNNGNNNSNNNNNNGAGVAGGGGGNDPNLAQMQIEEQFRLQMQMYAYNNALGDMTDSTLSQASTPYPGMGPGYTPFGAFLNQTRKYPRARERIGMYNGGGGVGVGVGVGYGPGEDGRLTVASFRSSPSHTPVSLPPMPPALYGGGPGRGRGVKKRGDRVASLRGEAGFPPTKVNGTGPGVGGRVKPPPRVDSTQPRETSPEPISEEDEDSGEETAGEKYEHEHHEHVAPAHLHTGSGYVHHPDWNRRVNGHGMGLTRDSNNDAGENDNGEWVDEESDEEEELLDLEFHPSYVTNADRRRRRWEQRWDDLVRAFQALDKETDTTLLLLASPQHTNKLYSLSSRSIRRDAQLFDGHAMHAAKGAFGQIASQRRNARTQRRASLLERLYYASSGMSAAAQNGHHRAQGQDGSSAAAAGGGQGQAVGGEGDENGTSDSAVDGGPAVSTGGGGASSAAGQEAGEREEDLRRLLRTALHSLSALHQMYEEREARWRIEERRMREEREGVDLLVRQAFGTGPGLHPGGEPPPFLGLS